MLQFVLLLNKAHVKGHWRTTPTGQRVYVSPHERQDQEGYDPSQLPLFGAPAARPPEPAPPPKPEPEPEPEPEPVPTPEPEPEPEPVQAETTPATIPEYVKDAVKLNAERIHYFNEEVERLRKLGQRFGSPGRYEYEYRTEHEHQFDANVDKLKYIEGLAEKNGFSLEQLYAHVEGGRPEKIPWSMAASAWGRPREPKTTPEPTPPPAPAPEPEPTATTPEPWQMTRREFRHAENAPKVQAIQAAIRAGKRITAVTQLRVTPLTSPEHIRLTSTGHVQTRERTTWVNMTDDMVDTLAAQAGMKLPDFMEKVYHRAEVAQALKEGKPVPPEVLAEYPELSSQEDEEPEEAPPAIQHRPLTEDAIHNWDAPYIQKQYGEHPEEIRQAAMQAMRRHHQKGTSAREEAQALNAQFGLTKEPEPTPTPEPVDTTTAQLDQAEHDLGDLEGDVASTERAHTADTEDEQDDDAEGDGDEGEQTFSLITGRTYPLRRDLVSLGARWHADEKGYIVPTGKAEQVEAYARSKGLTVGKVDLPAEDYHREKLTGEALRAHRQAGLDKKITRWRSQAARLEKQAAALEARLKPYDDMQFWTEPLKPDHYSYNRHRNLRERLRAMMDKRMGMLRDAHALRQKADGWDRAGAQIAGDRERQRQAQREMVSSQVTVGSRIHDAIYGKGTVVKVNPKTFTVRYDNGHTSATDKSHAMPLGETVPLAELKEQTRPKYKKGDTVRFNSFGQDRVGTITSVGPRSYSIRVHGAVQTSPLKVDHQRVLGPDTTPEPAPAAAPSAPLRRGQFVRFTHGVLSSTPRYGTITNVGPDTYTIRAMDGGRILEVNHKDVMAKARNTPRLVLLLNKAHVKGHWRTIPTGQRVYVAAHERQDDPHAWSSQMPLFGAPRGTLVTVHQLTPQEAPAFASPEAPAVTAMPVSVPAPVRPTPKEAPHLPMPEKASKHPRRAESAPAETYALRPGGRFNFTSQEIDQIVTMIQEYQKGADHPSLRLRPQVKEYALAYNLLEQADRKKRPTFNFRGRFQPMHDLPPEALWRIVEPMLEGQRSRGASITRDPRWTTLDIYPVGHRIHRNSNMKEVPGAEGEPSTWVEQPELTERSEQHAMEAQAEVLGKLALHQYLYFQRGGSIWDVSRHERYSPPIQKAHTFTLGKARVKGHWRMLEQGPVYVHTYHRPDRPGGVAEPAQQLGLFGAPVSSLRTTQPAPLKHTPEPPAPVVPERAPVQIAKPEPSPPPKPSPFLSFPNDTGTPTPEQRQDAIDTVWNMEAPLRAFERFFTRKDAPPSAMRTALLLYQGARPAVGERFRERLTTLTDTTTRRSLHAVVDFAAQDLTNVGQHLIAMAMKYGMRDTDLPAGLERDAFQRYQHNNPYARGTPLPPDVTPAPAPAPEPALTFPADDKRPSKKEREQAYNAVWAVEGPLHDFESYFTGPNAPNTPWRGALNFYRGARPGTVGTHYRAAVQGIHSRQNAHPTPTRASLHRAVERAQQEMESVGKKYMAAMRGMGMDTPDVPPGPLRDTFTQYARLLDAEPAAEQTPAVPPAPPSYRSLSLKLDRTQDIPVTSLYARTAKEVAGIFEEMRQGEREKLMAVHTDADGRIRSLECISMGTLNSSPGTIREVLKAAVVQGTSGMWLIHNHPSGASDPSEDDKVLTRKVNDYGKRLGITLHGHVVIGEHGYHALNPEGHTNGESAYPTGTETEGKVPMVALRQHREAEPMLQGKQLKNWHEVADMGKQLLRGGAHQTYVVLTDTRLRVNAAIPIKSTGEGQAQQDALNEVLRQAILHNAHAVTLVSDVEKRERFFGFSKRLHQALDRTGMHLMDAVHLRGDTYASARGEGMIKALVIDLSKARKLHGRRRWQGMQLSIENRKGSIRRGHDHDGKPWANKMQHPYGYIKGTVGMDGAQIDCFVGPHPGAPHVYVVTTRKAPDFQVADEQKCFIGFTSAKKAKQAFLTHYDDPRHFGNMLEMPVEEFKAKAKATMENPGAIQAV